MDLDCVSFGSWRWVEAEKATIAEGGSGYVIYGKTTITPDLSGETSIIADVGDQREASTISINGDVKRAESGKDRKDGDHEKNGGGDGYSGGGDHSGSSDGGSNGANGGGEGGGAGTGEDITKYVFNTWQLSPGEGGKIWDGCSGGSCGGGCTGWGSRSQRHKVPRSRVWWGRLRQYYRRNR